MQMHHLIALFSLCFSRGAWGGAIVGAGTALPAQLFADAQFAYRFTNPTVELQYYPSESQAGVCRIESAITECDPSDTRAPNSLDFASSIGALNQSDYDDYPDIQLYPVLATAIVPVYNLKGVQGLILSTTVLSQIFSGQISTWDDSRIKLLNPNFTTWKVPANQSIQLVVLQESNDVTMAFKTALLDFSKTFSNYVEMSARPSWGNLTNPTMVRGAESLLSYVLQTPWTISYATLKHAVAADATQVTMSKSGSVTVQASLDSTTFAVLETGSNFGNRRSGSGSGSNNNGNNGNSNNGYGNDGNYNKTQGVPSRLYADLSNARGDNAWPIVTYVFVVLRKSTLRSGATCDDVSRTVAFWHWFLTATVVDSIAEAHYFARPAEVVRNLVMNRLVTDVTCNGQPVFHAKQSFQVMAAGQASVGQVLQQLAAVYTIELPQVSFGYTSAALNTSDAVAAALGATQFVAVRQPGLAPASGAATLLFAGVALVVVSQYDLVLDVPTLVRILEGDIQTWLDPALLALNPTGLRNATGSPLTNASQRILLFNGPTSSGDGFGDLMRTFTPGFAGQALQAAPLFGTEDQLRLMVAGAPFSLAVTSSNGEFSPLKLARFQRSPGVVVAPTPAAIIACASSVPYTVDNGLALSAASSPACYPLADLVYLAVRSPACDAADSVDATAVAFLAWALGANATAAALQGEGLALLAAVSPAVQSANAAALSSLLCTKGATRVDSANIVPIIVGAIVGVLFCIAVPAGWYVWKSTRDMRALRKQFSDVKVAEDCAEAIACFDLEAVSWLSTLAKPSKIQLAFLRIVSLLVEVKPFIPDQLIAQLQAVKKGEELPKPEERKHLGRNESRDDDRSLTTSQSHKSIPSSLYSGPSSVMIHQDSMKRANAKQPTVVSEGSSAPRRAIRGRSARGRPSSISQPGGPALDRYCRTCTYMYVRFVLKGDMEEDRLGQRATTVAAHVVTVAKGHGATIDKVTYDSVALHWNVAAPCASAPLQATALALELACAAQILPPEAQADLRLLIGIGHGPCTVATVSAAGQRFFVVGGPEVSNAVEVVVRELAVPVGCTVLLSNSVQQEVKYGFRCSPRLWYRDVLFWEPVQQRAGCGLDDEWMYQIQRIEETDASLDVTRALHDVFQLAHTTQSLGVLQREVRHVQQMYAADLSPQDLASLRLLQDTFGGHSRTMVVSAV